MKRIVVIDGMGGGIGVQLVSRLKEVLGDRAEIIALGTNGVATERMIRAGAHRGAAGENAIRVSAALGDIITGPLGIVIPNSLMGEITAAITEAILAAPGERVLLPLAQEHFYIPGLEKLPLAKLTAQAVDYIAGKI